MDIRRLLPLALLVIFPAAVSFAQKKIYIPYDWRKAGSSLYAESDPDYTHDYSMDRSYETDNAIIFWSKEYRDTIPTNAKSPFNVDIEDLGKKVDQFYELETGVLGFNGGENDNTRRYKVIVCVSHTRDWVCYGSGYDYTVPAIWLGPTACHPVGGAVAHEIGHSFHYMSYSEASAYGTLDGVATGFHYPIGNGGAIWETTANWQAIQSYPSDVMGMSGGAGTLAHTHNFAFGHEWHRYQAYPFLEYLCDRYDNIRTISDIWNYPETEAKDFHEVLKDYKGLTVDELYGVAFDYAMHAVTWDIKKCRENGGDSYIGKFDYRCCELGDSAYQVAFSSCPQSTGFNVIPLNVPASGKTISVDFTALRAGADLSSKDPAQYYNGGLVHTDRTKYVRYKQTSIRGFRLGFVLLKKDGTRQYICEDSIYCRGTAENTANLSLTIPSRVEKMWLVVSPSLSKYVEHLWNDEFEDDDMWPYSIRLHGTDLTEYATVYTDDIIKPVMDGRPISNVTFTYDITQPLRTDWGSTYVEMSGLLNTAFQLTNDEINSRRTVYSKDGPSNGEIMLYGAEEDGTLLEHGETAGYVGHWFDANGKICVIGGSSRVFSNCETDKMRFGIGQYPGNTKAGDKYKFCQALKYKDNEGRTATALFIFNLTIGASSAKEKVKLASYTYGNEEEASITSVDRSANTRPTEYYTLDGVKVNDENHLRKNSIYISGGKKFLVR